MKTILYWRRLDLPGLERLELDERDDAITAHGSVICLEGEGLRLDHHWRLTPDWRALSVRVERWGVQGHAALRLERVGDGWAVDGHLRADLDGVDEPDLSVTPFCNSLPIRRVPESDGASLTLDTAFIDGATLSVARSRQRYERIADGRLRYVDLGLSRGFEAVLEVDRQWLVHRYEHLFEAISPGSR